MEIPVTGTTIIYAILYLLLFRLSIVALGAMSIFLGYRLFVNTIDRRRREMDGDTEMSSKVGSAELSFKSNTPGTAFAAFGALITIMVLATNPVEFKLTEKVSLGDDGKPAAREVTTTVRGDEDKDVLAKPSQQAYEDAYKYLDKAIKSAQQAASDQTATAEYHATLAALYFADGKVDKAVTAQKEALRLAPDNAAFDKQLKIYEGVQ